MEPASALAQIALGAATLMPNATVEKKPIELHVYLAQWQNNLSKEVTFEVVKEIGITESKKRPLISIPLGPTDINERVEIGKKEGVIYCDDNFILESCIQLKPQEDADCNLRLRFAHFVSRKRKNYINIVLSWHLHKRQATASCRLFDKTYRWNPDESLKSIHLIVNGTLAGELMEDPTLSVQEIRCAKIPTLLELTLQAVNCLIDERLIARSLIPKDKHEMLDKLRFIENMTKKLPTEAETP